MKMKSIILALSLACLVGCLPDTGGKASGIDSVLRSTNDDIAEVVGEDSLVISYGRFRHVIKPNTTKYHAEDKE